MKIQRLNGVRKSKLGCQTHLESKALLNSSLLALAIKFHAVSCLFHSFCIQIKSYRILNGVDILSKALRINFVHS